MSTSWNKCAPLRRWSAEPSPRSTACAWSTASRSKPAPYFKLQEWKEGRNQSRRVSPEEAAALRAAIAGRQRFEGLAAEFIDLTVAATHAEAATPEQKKTGRRKSTRRSSPKRRPS